MNQNNSFTWSEKKALMASLRTYIEGERLAGKRAFLKHFTRGFMDVKSGRECPYHEAPMQKAWQAGGRAWKTEHYEEMIGYYDSRIDRLNRYFANDFYAENGGILYAIVCGCRDPIVNNPLAQPEIRLKNARKFLSQLLTECQTQLAFYKNALSSL